MRIIVTGGSGFIGYHLAEYLSSNPDNEVTVIDNHERGGPDGMFKALISKPNVVFLNMDMTEKAFYQKLTGRYDCIYHLAAINGTKNFYERPYDVMRVNILSLMNMLEWCTPENCGGFMFTSSSEAYAGTISENPDRYIPTSESIPLSVSDVMNPRWSYGGSKITGELLTVNYCRIHNVSFRIIRYHNIYGVRMGYDHVLPEFFRRIHERVDPFPVYGGEETRAFCAVADAVRATEAVMLSSKCDGEIVHIGNSGQEVKIIDLLKMCLKIAGYAPEIKILPAPEGCVARRCPDTEKLYRLTGFKAGVGLEEALPEMYRWYDYAYKERESLS